MASNSIDNMVIQTGNATTDSGGEVTVFLTCFKPNETPCIVATCSENAAVNLKDLALVGSTWTAKLITSSPNTNVQFHAFTSTSGIPSFNLINLITQDLQDILAQDNNPIFVQ